VVSLRKGEKRESRTKFGNRSEEEIIHIGERRCAVRASCTELGGAALHDKVLELFKNGILKHRKKTSRQHKTEKKKTECTNLDDWVDD